MMHPLLISLVLSFAPVGSDPTPTSTVAATPVRPVVSRDWNLRQTPIVDAIRGSREAIVNIHSERSVNGPLHDELLALTPSQNRVNGMGTGIIIDPRGYIITNQHVVDEVSMIRVRLADGTSASAGSSPAMPKTISLCSRSRPIAPCRRSTSAQPTTSWSARLSSPSATPMATKTP